MGDHECWRAGSSSERREKLARAAGEIGPRGKELRAAGRKRNREGKDPSGQREPEREGEKERKRERERPWQGEIAVYLDLILFGDQPPAASSGLPHHLLSAPARISSSPFPSSHNPLSPPSLLPPPLFPLQIRLQGSHSDPIRHHRDCSTCTRSPPSSRLSWLEKQRERSTWECNLYNLGNHQVCM